MEPLPVGANFKRAKMLWEIGLHVAGDFAIPYGGNRDMCITVGSGGQADFRPSLSLATGSAIMAHEAEIPWEERSWTGLAQAFTETEATPMDVPLHPGTERWLKDNAGRL